MNDKLNFDRQLDAEIYRHCNDKIKSKKANLKQGDNDNIPLDALVSLPAVQINQITLGDSLELTGCVPAKADLILEDMPYNTTACNFDKEPIDLEEYWESRLSIIKPMGTIILTASQPFTSKLVMSKPSFFAFACVWNKRFGGNFVQAKRQPIKIHEDVLFFTLNGRQPKYNPQMVKRDKPIYKGGNKQSEAIPISQTETAINFGKSKKTYEYKYPESILNFDVRVGRGLHPTQKPVGLFEYLIRTYTNEGDLVFDGFGGSGTTAIAAYRTKRNFIVIEKDKRYFEIASKRLYQECNPLSTFDEAS